MVKTSAESSKYYFLERRQGVCVVLTSSEFFKDLYEPVSRQPRTEDSKFGGPVIDAHLDRCRHVFGDIVSRCQHQIHLVASGIRSGDVAGAELDVHHVAALVLEAPGGAHTVGLEPAGGEALVEDAAGEDGEAHGEAPGLGPALEQVAGRRGVVVERIAGLGPVADRALELRGHEAADAGAPGRVDEVDLLGAGDGRDHEVDPLEREAEILDVVVVDHGDLAVILFELWVFLVVLFYFRSAMVYLGGGRNATLTLVDRTRRAWALWDNCWARMVAKPPAPAIAIRIMAVDVLLTMLDMIERRKSDR